MSVDSLIIHKSSEQCSQFSVELLDRILKVHFSLFRNMDPYGACFFNIPSSRTHQIYRFLMKKQVFGNKHPHTYLLAVVDYCVDSRVQQVV